MKQPDLPTPFPPPPADNAPTLADLLREQAAIRPEAPALLLGLRHFSYADLAAESAARADALPASGIHCCRGDNESLALNAYAASWKKLPFFPVDRDIAPETLVTTSLPAASALLIASSGSEGQAKVVLHGARQLHAAATAANRRLPLAPGDLWLACMPLCHIGGQSILWRAAVAGAAVMVHPDFKVERLAAALHDHPVTHLSLVPAMLARLLEQNCPPPPSLRHVLIGGAALAPALHARGQAAGWPLHPSYGMSETAAQIATWVPGDGPWQAGLVGRPLDGCEIAIGEDGRIRVRSPQLMLAYLGRSRQASAIDASGWLTTGDLGRLDASGRLFVTGRADDMLISGGRNIHPLEIEAQLASCPGVRDIAVTGLPDPVWGDRIVALLVGDADEAQLLAHARRHLPAAALPRHLIRVERLPRNAAGKLSRADLRALATRR